MSVARILTKLESDPACGSYQAVYAAAAASGDTLYGFWEHVTGSVSTNQAAQNRLAVIAQQNNVAPTPYDSYNTITQAGETFSFSLPATTPMGRITFDTVTLVLHDANGGIALTKTFQVSSGPDTLQISGGLQFDDPKNPVTPAANGRGAHCKVHWTVPAADWATAVADLNANVLEYGGTCLWELIGDTNIMNPNGTGTGDFTSYTSDLQSCPWNRPFMLATSFTATTAGNNTLDLGYDIFAPTAPPAERSRP